VGLLTNKSGRRFRTDLRSTLTARVTSVGGRKWKGREAAGGDKGNARKGLAAEVVERSGVKWAGLGCYDLTSGLGCRPFRVTEKLQGYRSHCTLGARPWRPAHLILLARPCPCPCPCPDNEFDLVWGGGVEGGGRCGGGENREKVVVESGSASGGARRWRRRHHVGRRISIGGGGDAQSSIKVRV
jgi:hypothetical protein